MTSETPAMIRETTAEDTEYADDAWQAHMQGLFDGGQWAEIIDVWGADTARSHDFKTAAWAGWEPRPADLVVSTYPKSGTTWALQVAYQAGYLGAGEFEHFDQVVPWPDQLVPGAYPPLDDLSHLAGSPTGLRVIKSHLEADYHAVDSVARFISVIRDPKDLLVSLIKFENDFNELMFGSIVPPEAWADAFTTDRFTYQPWPGFIDGWWRLRHRENVLVLTYEEMKSDSDAAVRRIVDFAGVELTAGQLAAVAERSAFAWMKANDHRFAPESFGGGNVSLVREGKTGAGRTGLSAEHCERIDAWCLAELERLGSDFPYAELYAGPGR